MKLVFAGTPEFSVAALDALHAAGHEIAGVYTQPDRPAGRGRQLSASPVARRAQQLGLPLYKPARFTPEALAELAALRPELMVVVAYGLILPQAVLDVPVHGCFNIHASLLPRWRGASPIQQAILAGDEQTGITLMQMDTGLDTGDMLLRAETEIGPAETAAELHDRLAEMAADLLVTALDRLDADALPTPEPQDDAQATHAPLIRKTDAAIDWQLDARTLERRVRAYNPWPVAYGDIQGQPVRIFRARAEDTENPALEPGTPITAAGRPDSIRIACGQGVLEVLELQAPGRKRVTAAQWLNANPDWKG